MEPRTIQAGKPNDCPGRLKKILTPETTAVQPLGTVSSKLLSCNFPEGRDSPSSIDGKAPDTGMSVFLVKVQLIISDLISLLNSTYTKKIVNNFQKLQDEDLYIGGSTTLGTRQAEFEVGA